MFRDVFCHVSFDEERQQIATAQALQPPINLAARGSGSLLDIGLLVCEQCFPHTSHGAHRGRDASTP